MVLVSKRSMVYETDMEMYHFIKMWENSTKVLFCLPGSTFAPTPCTPVVLFSKHQFSSVIKYNALLSKLPINLWKRTFVNLTAKSLHNHMVKSFHSVYLLTLAEDEC